MLKSEKSETPDKAKHLSLHKCNKATKASGTLKFSDIFVGINLKKRERNLELVLYFLFMFLSFHQPVTRNQVPKTKCHPYFCCCRNLKRDEKAWSLLFSNCDNNLGCHLVFVF